MLYKCAWKSTPLGTLWILHVTRRCHRQPLLHCPRNEQRENREALVRVNSTYAAVWVGSPNFSLPTALAGGKWVGRPPRRRRVPPSPACPARCHHAGLAGVGWRNGRVQPRERDGTLGAWRSLRQPVVACGSLAGRAGPSEGWHGKWIIFPRCQMLQGPRRRDRRRCRRHAATLSGPFSSRRCQSWHKKNMPGRYHVMAI